MYCLFGQNLFLQPISRLLRIISVSYISVFLCYFNDRVFVAGLFSVLSSSAAFDLLRNRLPAFLKNPRSLSLLISKEPSNKLFFSSSVSSSLYMACCTIGSTGGASGILIAVAFSIIALPPDIFCVV